MSDPKTGSQKGLHPMEIETPDTPKESKWWIWLIVILVVLAIVFGGLGSGGVFGDSGSESSSKDEPCTNSNHDGTCSDPNQKCGSDAFGNWKCLTPCCISGSCPTGVGPCTNGMDCYKGFCTPAPCSPAYPTGACTGSSNVCIPSSATGFTCGKTCTENSCPTGQYCLSIPGNNPGCVPTASSGFTVAPVRKYSSFNMIPSTNMTRYAHFSSSPDTNQFLGISNQVNIVFYSAITPPVNMMITITVTSIYPDTDTWLYYGNTRIYKIPSKPGTYGAIRYNVTDVNRAFVIMSSSNNQITGSINFSGT